MLPITPDGPTWDGFVSGHRQGHVLQLSAWATLKQAYGWQAARVALADEGTIRAGAQLLFRPLPARLGTMAYLPFGPYVSEESQWPQLWQAIDRCTREHRAAFLKWEPGFAPASSPQQWQAWGFRSSPQTVQPPNTILIDLQQDEDAILARMNQGTRRKIRSGPKKDLRVIMATPEELPRFTAMMRQTGDRNAFGVHDAAYYELAHQLFAPEHAALFLAEHEGDTLAGVMVFALGAHAWYLYGASSELKRNLMASYAVQWEAIRWAKARGCIEYDLWGIPDADEASLESQFETRSDGLWGVYGFKRGWGGQIQRSAGAWDKVYNPFIYTAYRTVLRLRGDAAE